MAKEPKKTSSSRLSNIMGLIRGDFDFTSIDKSKEPLAFGEPNLISNAARNKILSRSVNIADSRSKPVVTSNTIMSLVQNSLSRVGNERLENRKILQLMPEVDKAARLMISSIMSPTDLSRKEVKVVFNNEHLENQSKERLSKFATNFFDKKLNLKSSIPSWIYQFGYETGSCVFAIIPLQSFEKIEDDSFIGTEAFVTKVIEPLCHESLFGFSDAADHRRSFDRECGALESFTDNVLQSHFNIENSNIKSKLTKNLIEKIIAKESLSLTDNPSILSANRRNKDKMNKRTQNVLDKRFLMPKAEPIVSIIPSNDLNTEGQVIGDPIVLRLPPESVTIIHTPGDPSDHQGYLVLLDRDGNPISSLGQETTSASSPIDYNKNQANIFTQVYNAYGMTNQTGAIGQKDSMNAIYNQIVKEHIKNRLDKSNLGKVEVSFNEAVYKCMFSRFLDSKQTRVLYLPKELVSYMTFEKNEGGYGVSRLDRIKFNLGMKMSVQVSKVLASIKSAMDNRLINVKFSDNLMEPPEMIYESIIREYINKSTMSFSIDPNVVQSQIADKAISIKGTDIPGMESFDLTNEPGARNSSIDFDPDILAYIDKAIFNGLKVPPATMNSLGEDEYARSVTTTNLFFSQDVAIDQEIVKLCVNNLLRIYAKYSQNFRQELSGVFPELDDGKNSNPGGESGDKVNTKFDINLLISQLEISLPIPSVAPSKAQFESLDAMISAITNAVTTLFSDDFVGIDDSLSPVIKLLRAKFVSDNIRSYLETSGISGIEVPETNFSGDLKNINEMTDGLKNISEMLKEKEKVTQPPGEQSDGTDDSSDSSADGY